MKSPALLAACLLICFAARAKGDASLRFPAAELDKLPYLHFSANNLREANIFRMRQEDCTIQTGGQRYVGFKFWSTGLVEWLFITTPGELQAGDWILVNDSGEQVGGIEGTDVPLEDCPRVTARYPQASAVTRYKTSGEALERRGRYHLLQRAGNAKSAAFGLSFTSGSPDSYEAGRSGELLRKINREPLRPSSDVVIENMTEMRRAQGMQAAADYLAREMELRIDDGENSDQLPSYHRGEAEWSYVPLFVNAWYEAQTGGGRLDADWAAAIYGAMYDVCLKRGYFARTDVAGNLTSSLALAGRYGKLADTFEIWKEGMRLGGYNMDAGSHPDLGPAFDIIPQVRKRRIPYLAPYDNAQSYKDLPHNLDDNFMACFDNHAVHLWFQGEWKESLEWLAWAHAWASDAETGNPKSRHLGGRWHLSLTEIANIFSSLGFLDQALALHENALRQEVTGGYEGKCTTRHKMGILKLKRLIGRDLPEDAIEQARASIVQAAGNIYEKQGFVQLYQAELGELLIHLGRVSEGEYLLDELAAAGSRDARIARLRHWVETGRRKGVESELRLLLKVSRETGRKMDEIVFYRLYADFLEQQGRPNEALKIRRELVRLCQSFDLFTHLPLEMARLAATLNKLGLWDESLLIADQARGLLGKGGLPDHLARDAEEILNGLTRGKAADAEKDPALRVNFQPLESIVIPLKGAPWVSHLTLANPSATQLSGMLRATGMPLRFREANEELEEEVDIIATLGGQVGDQEMKVGIAPATYKLIALDAADDFTGHGKFSLTWTPDQGEGGTESRITLEESIGGATRAIIQAGSYELNPFYGIPVYHHYVDTEQPEHSKPMRFVVSENARIEVYGMDGTPIAIDGQGNGSLRDAGDELFGKGDGQGSLLLPLTEGNTSFMVVISPQLKLPEKGLSLRIECLEGGEWKLYTEDRLLPAMTEQ